jgi:tetratricopeptide (TPR) repeat protein
MRYPPDRVPSDDRKRLPTIAAAPADPLERLALGDSASVISALRAELATAPDDEVAWLQLGMSYLFIDHVAEAIDALERAVALDGDVITARRHYAHALSRAGRHDEAAFQLVQARRLAPDDPEVRKALGIVFYDKRLFDKAIVELGRAVDLAPEDARARFALGLCHEAKNDYAAAIARYREAVRLCPELSEAHRTLADALAAMGELSEALAELEAALRVDRTNAAIAQNLEIVKSAVRELEARRLLGKTEAELERSTLVERTQLKRRARSAVEDGFCLWYRADLLELWLRCDPQGVIRRLTLVLPDPARAAETSGAIFEVTVVSEDGRSRPANFATAATLTFLREALGCPMTRAGELYARLLREPGGFAWGGVQLGFETIAIEGDERQGVSVSNGA